MKSDKQKKITKQEDKQIQRSKTIMIIEDKIKDISIKYKPVNFLCNTNER